MLHKKIAVFCCVKILFLLFLLNYGLGGLEDLGIGYCHTEGMGWNENVKAEDILADDWVIIEADDDNSTAVEKAYLDIGVYWTVLVKRPKCVDNITIRVGNVTQAIVVDPADFRATKNKIVVKKKICDTEILDITIVNKRGGFDAHLSNVRLVRQLLMRFSILT